MHYLFLLPYHPSINPIVNPADILPVNGIPKLVIANEEAVAVAWASLLQIIITEVYVVIFENFVITSRITITRLCQGRK